MSIEIYVSRFRHGERVEFMAAELSASFSELIAAFNSEGLLLKLGDDEPVVVTLGGGRASLETASLTVLRPVEDLRLYEALFRVLQTLGTVAYAPGSPPTIAVAGSKEHLPRGMSEALGATVEVSSARALREALFGR